MKRKKTKIGICSICGCYSDLTIEHIPPKGIFLKPRPKNTITIFSCEKCNQNTKLDDEYFRFWVTAGAHPKTKLAELWSDKVVGSSFKRSPALLKRIQDDHKQLLEHRLEDSLRTYDGEIAKGELLSRCYIADAERINRVACKIVRGLFFHHFKKPMPRAAIFNVSDAPIHLDTLIKIIIARKGMVGGEEGEFIYWFKFDDENLFHSCWVLLFYLHNYLIVETNLGDA